MVSRKRFAQGRDQARDLLGRFSIEDGMGSTPAKARRAAPSGRCDTATMSSAPAKARRASPGIENGVGKKARCAAPSGRSDAGRMMSTPAKARLTSPGIESGMGKKVTSKNKK
ncbi:unnamed protein product [Urochloa humidicola]